MASYAEINGNSYDIYRAKDLKWWIKNSRLPGLPGEKNEFDSDPKFEWINLYQDPSGRYFIYGRGGGASFCRFPVNGTIHHKCCFGQIFLPIPDWLGTTLSLKKNEDTVFLWANGSPSFEVVERDNFLFVLVDEHVPVARFQGKLE